MRKIGINFLNEHLCLVVKIQCKMNKISCYLDTQELRII